ncbi:MAG: hypothetical protein RLZZ362_157 [Actinomycetota bacterium]
MDLTTSAVSASRPTSAAVVKAAVIIPEAPSITVNGGVATQPANATAINRDVRVVLEVTRGRVVVTIGNATNDPRQAIHAVRFVAWLRRASTPISEASAIADTMASAVPPRTSSGGEINDTLAPRVPLRWAPVTSPTTGAMAAVSPSAATSRMSSPPLCAERPSLCPKRLSWFRSTPTYDGASTMSLLDEIRRSPDVVVQQHQPIRTTSISVETHPERHLPLPSATFDTGGEAPKVNS